MGPSSSAPSLHAIAAAPESLVSQLSFLDASHKSYCERQGKPIFLFRSHPIVQGFVHLSLQPKNGEAAESPKTNLEIRSVLFN